MLKFDAKATIRGLNFLERQQFPFAYALTLTQTAQVSKQAIGIQTRRVFKLHTDFIPRNIRIKRAEKSDFVKWGFAESWVFTGSKLDGWMGLHETSGFKKPFASGGSDKGKSLVMPGKGLKKLSFKTGTGKVRVRLKPQRLLKDFKGVDSHGRVRVKRRGRQPRKAFVVRSKTSNTAMIVRRKSQERTSLEVLYVFTDKAKINRSWEFASTVRMTANAVFERKFAMNFNKALNNI